MLTEYSKMMKIFLILNIVIWCFASIIMDFDPKTGVPHWGWVAFLIVTACKAWVASEVSIIIYRFKRVG